MTSAWTPARDSRPAGGATGAPLGATPLVLLLDAPGADDPALTGAKAANLARAAARGLPVRPGFVLTTAAVDEGRPTPAAWAALRVAWDGLTETLPVVVRSSSTVEDAGTSSMAGQFTSVLGVGTWDAFRAAVDEVLTSAGAPRSQASDPCPMAVLVQAQVDARCGGVVFGIDPVTGDDRHVVIDAVPGVPDALVGGTATAAHATLSRRGRLLDATGPDASSLFGRSRRHQLAGLAAAAAGAFGAPQDVEFAFDGDDRLWLLQTRPVTAAGDTAGVAGPVFGPGPLAETFPEPLRILEEELWVEPLREGMVRALRILGAVPRAQIARSPVVISVRGRVAADLELLAVVPGRRRILARLGLNRPVRRLVAAWRIGRLRAVLPAIAGDVVAAVDRDLTAVGDLAALDDSALLDLLESSRLELVALHGHEILTGLVPSRAEGRPTGSALALQALAQGRAEGLSDGQIVSRYPVTLALSAPAIGARPTLPPLRPGAGRPAEPRPLSALGEREALRLRARWVEEIAARAALELGGRLARAGRLTDPLLVRELTVAELHSAVETAAVPADLAARAATPAGPPLPLLFRLTPSGAPVAHRPRRRRDSAEGLGAGGGRGVGRVRHAGSVSPPTGQDVLVVETLDPRLAPELPALAGLVAASGSVLSHLAILARESSVPTVVAVPDALRRFPEGTWVVVDGTTGDVRPVPAPEGAA